MASNYNIGKDKTLYLSVLFNGSLFLIKGLQQFVQQLSFQGGTQQSINAILKFVSKTYGLCLFVVNQMLQCSLVVTVKDVGVLIFRAKMLEENIYCISLGSAKNCESWYCTPFSKWIHFNLPISWHPCTFFVLLQGEKKKKYVQFLPLLLWYRSFGDVWFPNLFKNFLLILLTG